MKPVTHKDPSFPGHDLPRHYEHIQLTETPALHATRCVMRPRGRPSFTPELLRELRDAQDYMRNGDWRYQILTAAQSLNGVFSLGGDLELFADLIERQDRERLSAYMRECVELVYSTASSPMHTIALVNGDALGGGFEAALAHQYIIAERGTRMGFPERLFNLFPGMGAYTFLRRRLTSTSALSIIDSARTYTAEEMHALGVIDALAEPGEGERVLYEYLRQCERYHNGRSALRQIVRTVDPVDRQELFEIGDLWVNTALRLDQRDLSYVRRLARSQNARITRQEQLGSQHAQDAC